MADLVAHSFSNFDKFLLKHLELNLEIDFDKKIIFGNVNLELEIKKKGATFLILDTRDLNVTKVTDKDSGGVLQFDFGEVHKSFGSPLMITVPVPEKNIGDVMVIQVEYETSPVSSAVQWLHSEQTAGREHPYVFTQCQAIHARSLLPCQDYPGVKATYKAKISVTKGLVALMSANRCGSEPHPSKPHLVTYLFHQPIAISSYLIALVAGALESREVGPRTLVWSEKEMVDKAAYEFAETEQMLQAAESIAGPYVWGRYDLLVLPPSFPYGGMENPCLTFVTPTLLAGDRSLANVVAHEISHSWTGNLATNETWEHFWLNEGFTVFLERKIIAKLFGEAERQFHAIGGWKALLSSIERFGASNPLTALVPNLKGVDPDDAFSSVPYEKGFALLYHLETILGGPETFDKYLRAHIEKFKHTTVNTEEWKAFLYEYFADQKEVLDAVAWDEWFYSPGMPPYLPNYDQSIVLPCTELAERWSKATEETLNEFSVSDTHKMNCKQLQEFLAQLLLFKPPLKPEFLKKMDSLYNFSDITNSEIRFRWLKLCVKCGWRDLCQKACEFVTSQGRMKFVRPIYKAMCDNDETREVAIETFLKNRGFYHNIASKLIAEDLKIA